MNSTSITRRIVLTVGLVSLCVALSILFSPSQGILVWPWDDQLLLDAFFVVAFVLACLLAPFVLFGGQEAERPDQAGEPPEHVSATPAPGHDLERILNRRWPVSIPFTRRQRVRAQFRQATIRTIVRIEDCPAEIARKRLERGTWTDDPVATAFVYAESRSESPRLQSLVKRVLFRWQARRTARAILTLVEEDESR